MDGRQAFLLAAHLAPRDLPRLFDRLQTETEGLGDCLFLFHRAQHSTLPESVAKRPHYVADPARLGRLPYHTPEQPLLPGRNHFPLLCYHQDHPHDFYWLIEYDVRFRGRWEDFFRYFEGSPHDLLTCHIRLYGDEPGWYWWDTLSHPSAYIPLDERLRSFNTIYRVSRRALDHIDAMHRAGWRGHQEVLVPTLLHRAGFGLGDFGGAGQFVAAGDHGRFYIDSRTSELLDGTMRYRPPHIVLRRIPKGMLAHPVKPRRLRLAMTMWPPALIAAAARIARSLPARLRRRVRGTLSGRQKH